MVPALELDPDSALETDADPPLGVARAVSAQRADLVRKVTDVLCLPAGQVNENERAFIGDILNDALDLVDETLHVEVAERLAGAMLPPVTVLRRLLRAPAAVAAPLLTRVKDIPDLLLCEACRAGPGHRDLVSRRLRMSGMVADVLVEFEDREIVPRVLRRDDVILSEGRIDRLVSQSLADESLCELLLARPELQPRHGFAMFWWVGRAQRRQILSRFAIDRGVVQNALKGLFVEVFPDDDPDLAVKRILTLCDRRHRPRNSQGEALSPENVVKMLVAARAHPTGELCAATGLIAGVSADTATRVLHDEGGEPFAILAKSAGVTRGDFAAILNKAALARRPDSPGPVFSEDAQEHLVAAFDSMARDYARTVLRYWDWQRDWAVKDRKT